MSTEEFHQYWKVEHAKVVAKLPGFFKYMQHHVISYPLPGYDQVDEPINVIVETVWESQEAAIAASQTPEMMAVVMDERNFFGTTNHFVHHTVVTESVEII
jgi:uncharacterized protein (TIGR02118 family)